MEITSPAMGTLPQGGFRGVGGDVVQYPLMEAV